MNKNYFIILFFICFLNYGQSANPLPSSCHSSCGGSQVDGTDCVSGQSGADKCLTCPGIELLVYQTSQASSGTCTVFMFASVSSICGSGKYGVFDTVTGTPSFCGAAGTSTTCVVCKATATDCSTYLYKNALTGGSNIFAFANADYFSTEPSSYCTACTDTTNNFIKVTTAGHSAGTCTAWATPGCSSTQAVFQDGSSGRGICLAPSAANTASAPTYSRKPCQTYSAQTTWFANDAAALDECVTCPADHHIRVSADGDTKGHCVLTSAGTDTSVYCAANNYLAYKTSTTTLCGTATTCVICKSSNSNCATFNYKTDAAGATALEVFTSEPTDRCLTCQGGGTHFVKVSTAGHPAGSCTAWATPGCSSTEAVFQDGSSGRGICLTPSAANTASAPTYSRKPCDTYTAQTTWFANDGAALDECVTCQANHNIRVAVDADTKGHCVLTQTGTVTSGYCSDNFYLAYKTTVTTLCSSATTCVICKASTTHCATFYYKNSATDTATALPIFTSEPSDRCLTCQGGGTYFLKISSKENTAGSCEAWSSPGCSSTEAIFQIGSTGTGWCQTPMATNTASAPTYSRKPCATYTAQTTWFADFEAALDECVTCPANHNLRVAADGATKGHCVLTLAGTVTQGYCADNFYLAYKTTTTTLCTTATTCVICKASTSSCATFSYKQDATSGGSAETIFSSEPTNRCLTCQSPTTNFIKLAAQSDIAGSCVTKTSHGCSATYALISKDGTSTLYYCKVPTASSPKEFCQTYAYHTNVPYMTDSEALDDCNACDAGQAFIAGGFGMNQFGNCINYANINSFCTPTRFLQRVSGQKGFCYQLTSTTISGFTAQVCQEIYYSSTILNYANNDAALAACISCSDSINHMVVGQTNSAIDYGTCLAYTSINQYCANYGQNYYLKTGSGSNAAYCLQATIGNSLPCLTFLYTGSQKSFSNNDAAITKCASCDPRKLLVNPDAATTTYGLCVDSPKLPQNPCGANQWVQQKSGQDFQGYCTTTAASGSQEQCATFFYGEALFFPNGESSPNNKCLTCANLLVRNIGEKFGKCYSNTANANLDCPSGAYLRKVIQDGVTFSFCQETPNPPSPFVKCTTYYYGANYWIDDTPENAYNYCASCSGYILKSSAGNSFGRCYTDTSKVGSLCNANNREYVKYIDATFSICQAPDSLATNQVGCQNYDYQSQLYIQAPGTIRCSSCRNGDLLIVESDTDQYGRCFGSVTSICDAGYFLQKVPNANKYMCVQSMWCLQFNYQDGFNNAIFWYIDNYHADADCNVCRSSYAQIASPTLQFKYCQYSRKCKSFVVSNYASIEDAEKKCTACNSGYYFEIATAGDTFGKCVASDSCKRFFDTSYLSTDSPNSKCILCKGGYWYKKADTENYGSCEKNADCQFSQLEYSFTASVSQTAETFSNVCYECKEGFFQIAPTGATDSACKAFEASSNCLQSANQVYADSAAASASCTICKENYFVKTTGFNYFGECTLLTKKYICLKFLPYMYANDESSFASKSCEICPSNFYYLNNQGQCIRCPGQCRTCLPDPSPFQISNGDFCTSCFDGSADLVLYTNTQYGKCLPCSGACRSCGGIYVNTAYNPNDRRCDSCGAVKYFAVEAEYDAGICVDCLKMNPNCLRCSSFGMCSWCKDGFFQNIEGNCVACKTDCAICRDADSCLVSQCVTGCANCTANTFDGCTQNAVGYFKDVSAYTQCHSGCISCSASTYEGCTQWKLQPTGTNCLANCKTCSGTAGTIAECTATVDGYYKTETAVIACITGCKTCTDGFFESCSVCFDGFYKNNNGQVCDKCHFNCATCSGPFMDECIKCKPIDGYQTFVRLPAERGSFGYCDFCHDSCKTCGGRASSPLAGCTSCWSGKLLEVFFTGADGSNNGWCVDSCPSGTFQEGTNCKKCILGSPNPCPQAPAVAYSSSVYLSLTITLFIALILLL